MSEYQLLIDYNGTISFDVIGQLLSLLKKKLDDTGEKVNTYKRIIIVMVESLENICKYFETYPEYTSILEQYPQVFTLEHKPGQYKLTARNPMHIKHIDGIRCKIDHVNELGPEELKLMHRSIIANGQFSKAGGAGLGFIEIAKASCNRIGYHFDPIDNSYTYFTICLELTN
jgi:hypothetical protein